MKKKILFSIYDMEIGGIERSLINMLANLDFNKYDVDLLICNHTGEFMSLIPEKVNILPEIAEYTVFRKTIIQCMREGHYLTSLIRIFSKILAEMKSKRKNLTEGSGYIQMQLVLKYISYFLPEQMKKYDVAVSYAWPHDIVVNSINAEKKIAWIHTDYSTLEIDNKIDFTMWNHFDHIASISEECTSAFLSQYPLLKEKIILIENITSPEFIWEMAVKEECFSKCEDSNFHIVSVGRLSYAKGFDIAIKALRILHDKGLHNIKWYVVGYGSEEVYLKKMILELNLENSFILLGKKRNPYPYVKACDLYVQPSRYEGKAVTVTEAKILRKPILITNYPTASSQLDDGIEGLICEASIEALVEGVENLYKNSQLRKTLIENLQNRDYSNGYELKKLDRIIEV
ncbi:capsular biosynthesis protein [Bacillus manliponensis]|uniref:Capsular biosynthesis protein n=1 Tax=Bacillus manliponensis TaxID=574376 RepID=A0A073K150_9BACI|nr:glycosyltransferase [Bacillus manliponensis]KEK20281.1 capsular biosynthesis protein [Bacillus manliponensis]